MQTEGEVRAFFDVDPMAGLSQQEALKRLAKFGPNIDPRLSDSQQRALSVRVLRQGKREVINFRQLVPGDIVLLEPGNRVPTDIRLISVDLLSINQNGLTGEPLPAQKNTFTIKQQAIPKLQKNMAFAGSFVTGGSGVGIVVARGNKTLLYSSPKPRTVTLGIKGAVIARRLRRFGVIVQEKRVLSKYRKIDTVVVDARVSDDEMIEIIRKVQLTRHIDCKFIVKAASAARLSRELGALVYDAETKQGDLLTSQILIHVDKPNSVSVLTSLKRSERQVLWVSDGERSLLALNGATISLVCGTSGRDDVILAADIFAPAAKPAILTRILYNKK